VFVARTTLNGLDNAGRHDATIAEVLVVNIATDLGRHDAAKAEVLVNVAKNLTKADGPSRLGAVTEAEVPVASTEILATDLAHDREANRPTTGRSVAMAEKEKKS
jgi:hypothetical protein